MEQTYRKAIILTLVIGLALMIGSIIYFEKKGNAGATTLWKIINQRCVPNFKQTHHPAPCIKVNLKQSFAIYKADKGTMQYLLLPLQPIAGIESEQSSNRSATDYLALGWQERRIVAKTYGSSLSDDWLAVSINSVLGRSQNHLHLHLSCLRKDSRASLLQWSKTASANVWQPIRLRNHDYLARIMSLSQMREEPLLARIAREIPLFRQHPGEYGVAMTGLQDGRMVLLVVKQAVLKMNFAHPEELQDHACSMAIRE